MKWFSCFLLIAFSITGKILHMKIYWFSIGIYFTFEESFSYQTFHFITCMMTRILRWGCWKLTFIDISLWISDRKLWYICFKQHFQSRISYVYFIQTIDIDFCFVCLVGEDFEICSFKIVLSSCYVVISWWCYSHSARETQLQRCEWNRHFNIKWDWSIELKYR